MKSIFLFAGLLTAAAVVFIAKPGAKQYETQTTITSLPSPKYKWTQAAPPGSGTHQYEWKDGTYPSAIKPLIAFDKKLWMVGQNRSWSSSDGIHWEDHGKQDWGERISLSHVFFRDTYFISGGMRYASGTFLNEIWTSKDGKQWSKIVPHAEWSPRKNHSVIEFKDRLWLFGGETSVDKDNVPNAYINDVWSSGDGIHWTKVFDQAPWEIRGIPQLIVFKDKLWLVGGQGKSDVWNSADGKDWKKIADESPWKGRFDYGLMSFDGLLWIYGGRESNPRNAYNDVWFSPDGVTWIQQTAGAPWSRRSGGFSATFHDKLFLYGGKHTGHDDSFSGDIWTLERQ